MKHIVIVAALLSATAFAGDTFALKGDAAKGKAPYTTFCVSCHGEKGDGKGPAGAALTPPAASFTDAKRAAELDDATLYKTIAEGGPAVGKSPMMIGWKASMKDQEIRDVAAYVRTFAPKAPAAPAKADKKAKK